MIGRFLYFSVIGLASETLQLHRQLNQELFSMTSWAVRGVELQSIAADTQVEANELTAAAARDKAAATALEAEAAVLEEKSAEEQAAALAKEAQAADLSQVAAAETREAAEHALKAAAEDLLAKEEVAAGAEMVEVAATTQVEVEIDETAVAVCQFIPFLNIACDFIGGLAATTLEIAAIAEASEAAADFAAAGLTKEKEDSDLALAADFEAQAVAETAEVALLEEQVVALEEEAAVEAAEAAKDEAAAEEETAKSFSETEAAAADEAAAAEEEMSAAKAFEESVRHGVQSVLYALCQVGSALVVTAYFFVRLIGGFVVPSVMSFSSAAVSSKGYEDVNLWFSSLMLSASAVVHALGLFVLVAATYDVILDQPNKESRGGTVMVISLSAMLLQALLLHMPLILIMTLPQEKELKVKRRFEWRLILHIAADLGLLFAWNSFLCFMLSSWIEAIPTTTVYFLGPFLFWSLMFHHLHHYKHLLQEEQVWLPNTEDEFFCQKLASTETTGLLNRSRAKEGKQVQQSSSTWLEVRHALLFEILVTSVLFAIVWNCLSRTAILRPFWTQAKAHLWSLAHHWMIILWSLVQRWKWQLIEGLSVVWLVVIMVMVLVSWKRSTRIKIYHS